MHPSGDATYPMIRRLRFHQLPRLVLEREFVQVDDEIGLISGACGVNLVLSELATSPNP